MRDWAISEKRGRVLAIGLDGGTFGLLEPMARRGVMPELARLMERGCWGTLRSTVPPVTAPAWTSFLTGKNPGGHGIYQFFSLDPLSADALGMGQKTYLAIPGVVVNATRIPGRKLWGIIDAAGLAQVTLNLPMAWPPEPVNGVMVSGMLAPPGSDRVTWPPELAASLTGYEIDLDPREKDFSGDNRVFLGRVRQILDKRIEWSLRLMRERPWDFFMTVFTESDRLQHRFYDLLDERLLAAAPPERRALVPLLEELYRRMDEGLGQLVREAGEGVHVLLMSDHGFGPAPVDLVDLRVLNAALGLEAAAPAGAPAPAGSRGLLWRLRPTKARAYKYLSFLPAGWLKRMEAAFRRRRLRGQKAVLFKMHENVGGVWINAGVLGRGEDRREARRALARELRERLERLEWKGERMVERVASREELYRGPHLEGAPELVFILREEYGILEPDMAPPRGELVVRAEAERPRKKGTHRMEGMFLLAGPGVRPGRGEAAIEDAAAAILYLLDIPVPADFDGRVPAFALDPDYLERHPLAKAEAGDETSRPPARGYDADEERAIKERLEGIGYLD